MKDINYFYSVIPGIILVGKETEVTITPNDCKYDFKVGNDYLIEVWSLTRRKSAPAPEFKTVNSAHGNKLSFTWAFTKEEEYFIRLYTAENNKFIAEISVYAVEEDLYNLRPLKGDFHVHTCRSDGRESPAVVAANYRGAGFDFMAVTDHYNYNGSVEMIESYKDVKLGMTLVNGEEVHSPRNYVHIVNFGSNESVNEIFQKEHDLYYREVEEIINSEEIPYEDKFTYAAGVWVARKIRERNGLPIFCHPHWIESLYNVPDDLTRAFIENHVFDAWELIGGQTAHENNMQTAMYNQLRSEGINTPIVGASDSHGTINSSWFNKVYSIVFAKDNTLESIQKAVREYKSVAVETYDDSVNYSVHGSYRLVSYARYLIENYFARTAAFCAQEGFLMREYLLGIEGAKERLEALCDRTDNYYSIFFGKK